MIAELTEQDINLVLSCIGVALTVLGEDRDARQMLEQLQHKIIRQRVGIGDVDATPSNSK